MLWKPQRCRLGTSSNPKEDIAKSPVPTLKLNSVLSVIVADIPKTSAGELVSGVRNSTIQVIDVLISHKKKKQLKRLIKPKRKKETEKERSEKSSNARSN